MLFGEPIENRADWVRVYQSIEAWRPLIEHIFARNGLPMAAIEPLPPGSNAVFRVGDYAVKIFAPVQADVGSPADFDAERFGLEHAGHLGVPIPQLAAHGTVHDRYPFRYIVSAFAEGRPACNVPFSRDEKLALGRRLRAICDRWNVPCAPWGGGELPVCLLTAEYEAALRDDGFTEQFIKARKKYLRGLTLLPDEFVFCHADLCMDNYLLHESGELYVLDFADAQYAPVCVEHAVAAAGFSFEKPYMQGFFGDIPAAELTELCLRGLLLSINGRHIFKHFFNVETLNDISDLKEQLFSLIKQGGTP